MSDHLATRACEIQRQKMTAVLASEMRPQQDAAKPRVRIPAGRRDVRDTIEAETPRFTRDEQEIDRMVW